MEASSDSGPLIWLSKCGMLHLLRSLYSGIVIPEAVYEEAVVRGLEEGYEDAQAIDRATEEGWIKIQKPSDQFRERVEDAENRLGIELGEGEREALALALERGITTLLTNDEDAYHTGKSLKLEPKGVLYILIRSAREGYVNKKQAKEALGQILGEGLWLSPTIIHYFHEALDRL